MHEELLRIFKKFEGYDVAIVGSAVKDYASARDVDVLFTAAEDFKQLARELGIPYRGGWDRGQIHPGKVHVLHYNVRGVSKPVELTQHSSTRRLTDHPYATLLRSGEIVHADRWFQAPPRSGSKPVHHF